ncbi:hypothetical protein PInf_005976 [Phytophthora infestans]|nr:hypothetical protein PInf_005976 [Phytophthora infestans]
MVYNKLSGSEFVIPYAAIPDQIDELPRQQSPLVSKAFKKKKKTLQNKAPTTQKTYRRALPERGASRSSGRCI